MQTFGSVEKLKENIKSKYDQEIARIKEETKEELKALRAETAREAEIAVARIKNMTHREVAQTRNKVFSDEKLKAKQKFEEAREELIKQVFNEVQKKMLVVAHSKRYLLSLKKKLREEKINKKDVIVIADGPYYKKIFPEYKKDPSIVGVKIISGDLTYDLSLSTAFDSNKEELRLEVSKILFGETK